MEIMGIADNLVVKSNDLIEGRYRMSVMAQKMAASIISLVDPLCDTKELPVFDFTVAELARLIEIDRNNARKRLESIMDELKKITIKLVPSEDPNSFVLISLFRTCGYLDTEGIARFEFEERLDPYIRYLAGNFTQYQVGQIRKLRSNYSIRLYEILRKAHPMHCKRKYSYTEYDIADLREMLGVKQGSYPQFTRFRHRVIIPAMSEIQDKTDLQFAYETIRKGRKIGAIKFIIRHNEQFEPVDSADNQALDGELASTVPAVSREKVGSLTAFIPSLPENAAAYLVANYDQDRLTEAALAYTQAVFSGTKIEKPGAYLFAILRNQRREDERWKSAQPTHFTTEEMLDTSWADEFQFQFEEDV